MIVVDVGGGWCNGGRAGVVCSEYFLDILALIHLNVAVGVVEEAFIGLRLCVSQIEQDRAYGFVP